VPPVLLELDRAAAHFLQGPLHSPGLSAVFGLTTSLLDLAGLVALIVLVVLRLLGGNSRRLTVLVGAFMLAALLTLVGKGLTGREYVPLLNPFPPDPVGESINPAPVIAGALEPSGSGVPRRSLVPEEARAFLRQAFASSFPSGHAARAAAIATSVALLWPALRWPLVLLAAWVAFSRAYIGAHWPLDVLAGVLLGLLSGWLAYRLSAARRSRGVLRRPGYRL
jgi:membrane-associated phospholipid phosphatase